MTWKLLLNGAFLFAMSSLAAQSNRVLDQNGETLPLTFGRDHKDSGSLSLGLRTSSEVDDNALGDNRNKQANVMTVIEPHVRWSGSHPELAWFIDYRNGFSLSHPLQVYSAQSHSLDAAFGLRPSKRLKIVITNTFQQTKDPFDSLALPGSSAGSSVFNRASASIFPGTDRTVEQAGGEVTYALSGRALAGASGSFFSVKYSAAGANQAISQFPSDGNSIGAHVFYSYHLTRHQWSGFDCEVQNMSFSTNSLVNSFLYTHKLLLSNSQAFSLYFGPQRSDTHGASAILPTTDANALATTTWYWAGGATYTWKPAAGLLQIGLSRRIDSSSALPGAALVTRATADFIHPLTRRWSATVAGTYDHESQLTVASTALSLVWVAGGFSRSLGHGTSLDFRYGRVHESVDSAIVRSFIGDHNRVSVSVAYEFKVGPVR